VSGNLSKREPVLSQFDSRLKNLTQAKLSTAESLNGIDPTGCGAGNRCSVYVVCWDLADFAIGDVETFADGLESLFGT
jgi:hypothetical protein